MKEDKLGNLSMELSVEVLNLVKELRNKKRKYNIKSDCKKCYKCLRKYSRK